MHPITLEQLVYVGLVYVSLATQIIATFMLSRDVFSKYGAEEDRRLRVAMYAFFVLALATFALNFVYTSRWVTRLGAVFLFVGVAISVHYTLTRADLTAEETRKLMAAIAGLVMLSFVLGTIVYRYFGSGIYLKFMVVIIMLLLLFVAMSAMGMLQRNKTTSVLVAGLILAIITFSNYELYTKYTDPNPFFQSMMIYADIATFLSEIVGVFFDDD